MTTKHVRETSYKAGLRADVYGRYKVLKRRGVVEESARNTAAAQSACAPGSKHTGARYRLELDTLLNQLQRILAL